MSAITFPAEFPCPLIEGTVVAADPSLLRADLGTGSTSQRRRNKLLPHTFSLAWMLPQADDYGRLVQWINRYGYDWFVVALPGPLAGYKGTKTTPMTVRFVTPITATMVPTARGYHWRVSLQAEWDPTVDGLPVWDGGPALPAGLPCPLIDPTTSEADPALVRTAFEAGNTRQRRANLQLPHTFRLEWMLPQIDAYATFTRWANEHGWDWFTLNMPGPKAGVQNLQLTDMRVRLLSDLQAQLIDTRSGYYWRVAAELQWQPIPDGLGAWSGGDGVWIIGGTADTPSAPDWVLAGEADAPSTPDTVLPGDPRSPAVLV